MTNTENQRRDAAGLEDVIHSVRVLARQARGLAESAGGVAERELAMALTVAEQLRDSVVSPEALQRVRSHELIGRFRHDAHRAVDYAFDGVASVYVFGTELVEGFLDRPRPPLASDNMVGRLPKTS
jgi:hypothetical protein